MITLWRAFRKPGFLVLVILWSNLMLSGADTLEWHLLLEKANFEINHTIAGYQNGILGINKKLVALNESAHQNHQRVPTYQLRYLQQQRLLEQTQRLLQQTTEIELLRIRFEKGIELIKILYEKLLALDHHFTGMQTYQNILMLSNPNTYPDF